MTKKIKGWSFRCDSVAFDGQRVLRELSDADATYAVVTRGNSIYASVREERYHEARRAGFPEMPRWLTLLGEARYELQRLGRFAASAEGIVQ